MKVRRETHCIPRYNYIFQFFQHASVFFEIFLSYNRSLCNEITFVQTGLYCGREQHLPDFAAINRDSRCMIHKYAQNKSLNP